MQFRGSGQMLDGARVIALGTAKIGQFKVQANGLTRQVRCGIDARDFGWCIHSWMTIMLLDAAQEVGQCEGVGRPFPTTALPSRKQVGTLDQVERPILAFGEDADGEHLVVEVGRDILAALGQAIGHDTTPFTTDPASG